MEEVWISAPSESDAARCAGGGAGPDRGYALAIGNFDGVHRGHQAVIAVARAEAERAGLGLAALTFEPHPRTLFRPGDPPFRLTLAPLKRRRLAALGLDRLYVARFDAAFSALSPAEFARFLAVDLGARVAVAGEDFRFGQGRAGDGAALAQLGAAVGLTARMVAPVGGAAPFSSSAARDALREGRPEEAARILGDWHRIEGPVIQGDRRGRELGFPTANQSLEGVLAPRFGVYAAFAEVLDGPHLGRHPAAVSLGLKPTFGDNPPNCETFLLDFSGDLYGATLSVGLAAYLRPEVAYAGPEPLIAQMRLDVADARRALQTAEAPPPWLAEGGGA